MKRFLATLLCCLCLAAYAGAQQAGSYLYKGSIDGKMPVTLYMKAEENNCTAELMYTAMYRYDNRSLWLQLEVTANQKAQFSMVEYDFTGLMILKKDGNVLSGTWISPDGKRQLKVSLKRTGMSDQEKETYEKKLEEVNYSNHDC